ncbi:MAG: hypothetical protein MUC69_03485 [Gemmatimonadales bacterium]|nr:hypothetical protein [Gemmatimonadales bacterium]
MRSGRLTRGLAAAMALCLVPAVATAQAWDAPAVTALLDRAAVRRAATDSSLRAWSAEATGTLRFLVDIGETGLLGPRVVKAEQLATQVHWRAPGTTEQRIVGRRDTALLPADVGFYRDRYGIVTNNLGDLVRLGDGNDVRDLPHPLSRAGRERHSFALADSLALSLPGRRVEVYEVLVRPREDGAAAMVGSLYLDRESGDLVRLAVTFTSAAILDRRIERLTLVLENLLVEGRYWLPLRQEVEVVRRDTWLDFPLRGIVRGGWQVCCHDVIADTATRSLPPLPADGRVVSRGPGGVIRLAPDDTTAAHPWPDGMDDALAADEAMLTDAEQREVRERAETLVQGRALDRALAGVSGRRISDFARFNRVEGLALGAGARLPVAAGWSLGARASYGFGDQEAKAWGDVTWRPRTGLALRLEGGRIYRDASDVAEVSGVRNSLGAALFGDDNINPYDVRGVGIGVEWDLGVRDRVLLQLGGERQAPLAVEVQPVWGSFGPTIPATALDALRLDATLEHRLGTGPLGGRWGFRLDLRTAALSPRDGSGDGAVLRGVATVAWERGAGPGTLLLAGVLGAVGGGLVPSQELLRFGGITTGPGYPFHAFAGRVGWSQRVEWRAPVPFPSVTLLSYGRSPPHVTLAPYAHVACMAQRDGGPDGCWPSVGDGALFLFDLLRLDVAIGLRDPGGWRVGLDVSRLLWGVL